ncbi:hypothetical protein DFH07DRAFT_966141 [Mycena maculata]|uniref:Uncharacterized protein n=1 Tax=Mycena maculata TaxID=230809 RepID=A0AAD7I9Q2_9AGAR|nr:hypothetical protein DFH07DRAFT_966141 [Mycena maculata]
MIARRSNTTTADDAQYGYAPSQTMFFLFLALFGLSMLLRYGAMYYRVWRLVPTATFRGVRQWSSTAYDPSIYYHHRADPTPRLAASSVILSLVVQQLGSE